MYKYGVQSMVLPSVDSQLSVEAQAEVFAPIIERWIKDFDEGKIIDGCETVQGRVVAEILRVCMAELKDLDVGRVIAHPDNREKHILSPIDAHELLYILFGNGYLRSKVDALASEMPPVGHPTRQLWLDKYNAIVEYH